MSASRWFAAFLAVALVLCSALLGGCGARQSRTTRLAADDVLVASTSLAQQLASSDWLATRHASDEPWIIAIDRVENLSSDVIPVGEQWLMIEKVRAALPMQSLSQDRAVRFVIPAERLRQLRGREPEFAEAGALRMPTHRMGGTIRSVTRIGEGGRTDLYRWEFEIKDLVVGETVWSGQYEIKRLAYGRSWD